MKKKAWIIAAAAAVCIAAVLFAVLRPAPGSGYTLLVDGEALTSAVLSPEKQELRIHLTLDGQEIADLPFGEPHTVLLRQENGDENLLRITEDSVFMENANCEGQDCVEMGEVTAENLELRVMGGFIICLPHRLSVEVRGRD